MVQEYSTTTSTIKTSSSEEGRLFNALCEVSIASVGTGLEGERKSVIESNSSIQGGTYCLRGTRVTIPGILEAQKQGRTIDETIKTLNKYFGVDISKKELQRAIDEYQKEILLIGT